MRVLVVAAVQKVGDPILTAAVLANGGNFGDDADIAENQGSAVSEWGVFLLGHGPSGVPSCWIICAMFSMECSLGSLIVQSWSSSKSRAESN